MVGQATPITRAEAPPARPVRSTRPPAEVDAEYATSIRWFPTQRWRYPTRQIHAPLAPATPRLGTVEAPVGYRPSARPARSRSRRRIRNFDSVVPNPALEVPNSPNSCTASAGNPQVGYRRSASWIPTLGPAGRSRSRRQRRRRLPNFDWVVPNPALEVPNPPNSGTARGGWLCEDRSYLVGQHHRLIALDAVARVVDHDDLGRRAALQDFGHVVVVDDRRQRTPEEVERHC